MAPSQFSVTKLTGSFVTPCELTPSATLPLSSIDKIYIPGLFAETIHVFKHGVEAAKVIREALSKALVPYYPMAGRLVRTDGGELQVACTGEGIWFVDASANCRLEEVDWLEYHPIMIPKEELLPFHPQPTGMIAMIQVTQFSCGGFVMGFLSDHTVNDGAGVAQFLNAISDLARGLQEPKIKPVWSRDSLPNPPKLPMPPLPPLPTHRLMYHAIDVSPHQITKLKAHFFAHTSTRCTTFELISAMLWQCRTRAIGCATDVNVRLAFTADIRSLLGVEGGYYGNCVFPVAAMCSSGEVVGASWFKVVSMIKGAKDRLAREVAMWAEGGSFKDDVDPFMLEMRYESIHIVSGIRLGFDDVDYGWGRTVHNAPLICSDFIPMCFLTQLGSEKGFRLITQCVKEEHFEKFQDEMTKWAAEELIK